MNEFDFEEELLSLYNSGYFHFIGRISCESMIRDLTCDDVANDLYIRCIKKRSLYRHDNLKGLRGWIFQIGRNYAYNMRRDELTRYRNIKALKQFPAVYDDGEEGYIRVLVDQVIDRLPNRYKEIFAGLVLGYKHKEVAEILKRPMGTIAWRNAEAKRIVAKLLDL